MLETYVLHITKECNMKCMYCYEKDKTSTYSWEEIKALLDEMVKYNKVFHLEFLGGEPCIRTDLICKTVDYLEGLEGVDVVGYTVTTNGTIVTNELVSLLKEHSKITWAASIDGHRFGNFMRILKTGENSYDTVIRNFKRLKAELGERADEQLVCHLVTHHFNIGYFTDGVRALYNEGFRKFAIGTIESTLKIDDAYCREFILQHKMLSDMVVRGELPGAFVGPFEGLKPETDERHYVRDETGRVILETYGRASGDIKDTEKYKTEPSSSDVSDRIHAIRREAFMYHQKNIRGADEANRLSLEAVL